jgi:hypothetical protein
VGARAARARRQGGGAARHPPYGDVLFAAIEAVRREPADRLWPLLRHRPERVG